MHHDHRDISEPAHFRHLIKTGIVSAIEADSAGRPFARMVYPDRQGITTAPFPILQRNTVGTVDHSCPRVGEMAVVLHLGTGLEQGIVLGCIHTDKVTPCVTDGTLNKRKVTFDDGSFVQFDPTTKALTVNTNGDVDVTTAANLNATVSGNVVATVTGNVEVTCTDLDATCSGEATLAAPTITLNGNVTVTGLLTAQDGMNISGTGATGGKTISMIGDIAITGNGTISTHMTNQDGSGGGS